MALLAGDRLGPYDVVAQIGVGGMGEVYEATDTNLKRAVAIKVLPASVAGDAELLARFQREAEVLASLNHPNIAAIYGLERSGATTALVMELVEGPTLADVVSDRGAGLPFDEALPIAKQLAEALEAAHEQGIVHRDLKPANIKVRPDGTVKVLDFGLAKLVDGPPKGGGGDRRVGLPENRSVGLQPDLTASPTFATPAMTQFGMILGTAAYMSPEQARGRAVDKRADIWAFGCVLYEMVTGARPFEGEDVAEVLGAVIHKDIAWGRLPATTPGLVRTLLERCLEKDPKQRIRDMGDVRLALAGAFGSPSATVGATAGKAPSSMRRWAAMTAAVAMVAAAIGAGGAWVARAPASPDVIAFTVDVPSTSDPASFALSPDGRLLAFTQFEKDVQKLWIRPLGSPIARVIPGTEQAATPFWSPDSRRVAFFAGNLLKQVDVAAGVPQTIVETTTTVSLGGSWNDDNVILFARAGTGILRVPAAGGEPGRLTTLEGGDTSHAWPVFLPDGRHFVYLKVGQPQSELRWRALDAPGDRVVRPMTSRAWYSPTGHLLFRADGPIVAQRFDAATGAISGDVMQIAGETWASNQGRAALSLSASGVLAHRGGDTGGAVAQLSWVDRKGTALGTVGSPGDYRNLGLDRAGERLVANSATGDEDVWVLDMARGTTSRLTFDLAVDSDPVFSPDGRSVAFYSARNPPGIYRKATSGAGADELVAETGFQTWSRDWSFDGRLLLFQKVADLWVLPMDGDRRAVPYLTAPAREQDGRFSPDAQWVVYSSDETGRLEVFVQDFPAKGAKFQVSTSGGSTPRWRSDGRELFYLGADGQLMSVSVDTRPEFRLGVPKPMFQTPVLNLTVPAQRRYEVSSDGQRFLMNVPLDGATLEPITVIVNWQSALEGR